ncbi:hypothetical protein DP183_12245 [Enterobacter kobei]|uniref:Uncharacterized protein n=1 Tax=Enterobacter kobei TaxID=208224 RepID=A0ABX9F551_9ENTR|nr:hypothetical protein DP181_04310 [Enterobacter kobei]RAY36244.1 hypothetical protein DP183_12245 [Enterobacter kobei]
MKHETIEAVLTEMARLQGQELNSHDSLKVRTQIASALTSKKRYQLQMNSQDYRWRKPSPPR